MDEAGRKREPLFPSAGELAGELSLAPRKAKPRNAIEHDLPPVLDPIHPRDEIEIFRECSGPPKS